MIPANFLPENTNYFIAGGWAICPALAQDRDVFVQTTGNLLDARAVLLDHLRAHAFPFTEETEERVFDIDYGGSQVNIVKVAKVHMHGELPIHLLVTQADVTEVLSTFDISTCQVAVTRFGKIVKGPDWTPITHVPVKLKDTLTTNARLEKYRVRLGFDFPGRINSIPKEKGSSIVPF